MKFIHTADLHLGRSFHECSLLEDQKAMLACLSDRLEADDYSALVVAGDIYDRSIPPPDAVALLGSFLGSLRLRFPTLAVVMVAGNHDSPERIAYGDSLFAELGIHVVGNPERSRKPVVVERRGEKCAFFALPFLSPGSMMALGEDDDPDGAKGSGGSEGGGGLPLRSQRDLASEAARRLEKARKKALAEGADSTVLIAHIFASGGAASESERVFLGTAEKVDPDLFSGFDYVALGHLHRRQQVAPNAWYSGSPLAYSFDEADQEKAFLSVRVGGEHGSAEVEPVPTVPLRRVSRLNGDFASFNTPDSWRDRRGDYLEISLSDAHLVENPLALLRARFPYLLSVRQDTALRGLSEGLSGMGTAPGVSVPGSPSVRRGAAEDFGQFLVDLYGTVDDGQTELFSALVREADDETA